MLANRKQCDHIPYTPDEIGEEARRAYAAGASVVHIHARNDDGTPTQSRERFGEAIAAIRAKTDCIIQPSTGGAVGAFGVSSGGMLPA